MQKFILTALVATGICLSVPTKAKPLSSFHLQNELVSAEIDSELVERIIRYVLVNYGLDYNCLCEQYKAGVMTIEKVQEGYLVRVVDGGNILEIIADDSI